MPTENKPSAFLFEITPEGLIMSLAHNGFEISLYPERLAGELRPKLEENKLVEVSSEEFIEGLSWVVSFLFSCWGFSERIPAAFSSSPLISKMKKRYHELNP